MPQRPETYAVHNSTIDPASGAIVPPIVLSTTFQYETTGLEHDPEELIYTRYQNPNRAALEEAMRKLEYGAAAHAISSGSAAMLTIFQALRPGDHIVSSDDMYFGIRVQLKEFFAPWGLETSFVDMSDLAALRAAMRPETRLVIFESPTNPMIRLADIKAISEIAHQHGATVLVDNTVATPVAQNPLRLGGDIVVNSLTKYIAGHHDVLGGVIVFRENDEFAQRVMRLVRIGGSVLSPMNSWLTLRGMQSLSYRVRAHSENASEVACFLAEHPKVERLLYPHHPSHPQYDLARRQMRVGSGLMSMQVRGGRQAAIDVVNKLRLFTSATSFGGTHSLIEHRESIEEDSNTPSNLLRVSIGLEHPADLIADLDQALR
ncbi:MAG: aminotransferase class I/II-fold pyridoxal phosphate-dependent enzyme [Chloroflexota bacterium]|nr:aminotransferase class I/II-fold pyridoxal phosphate-dependent enzyme [Chloroflexota bacterium]